MIAGEPNLIKVIVSERAISVDLKYRELSIFFPGNGGCHGVVWLLHRIRIQSRLAGSGCSISALNMGDARLGSVAGKSQYLLE